MTVTTISEAQAQFPVLIERVRSGEEVLIGEAGKAIAKLVPCDRALVQRIPGTLRGQIDIAEDFDELPEELLRAFGVDGP